MTSRGYYRGQMTLCYGGKTASKIPTANSESRRQMNRGVKATKTSNTKTCAEKDFCPLPFAGSGESSALFSLIRPIAAMGSSQFALSFSTRALTCIRLVVLGIYPSDSKCLRMHCLFNCTTGRRPRIEHAA